MSANLLTLNSSKTEFLIIGLKQQFSKTDNSLLNTTHSARNLGFIFDENLTFSDQISSFFKSCYSHICELRCSVLTLILKQPVPLLPLLSTLNFHPTRNQAVARIADRTASQQTMLLNSISRCFREYCAVLSDAVNVFRSLV